MIIVLFFVLLFSAISAYVLYLYSAKDSSEMSTIETIMANSDLPVDRLGWLIMQNQYIIQHMLSDNMDKTQQYKDLVRVTDEAYKFLQKKMGANREELQKTFKRGS